MLHLDGKERYLVVICLEENAGHKHCTLLSQNTIKNT